MNIRENMKFESQNDSGRNDFHNQIESIDFDKTIKKANPNIRGNSTPKENSEVELGSLGHTEDLQINETEHLEELRRKKKINRNK